MSEQTKVHPVLGTDSSWQVTNFMGTVELRKGHILAVIPKPYERQSPEWWREEARKAIAEATKQRSA